MTLPGGPEQFHDWMTAALEQAEKSFQNAVKYSKDAAVLAKVQGNLQSVRSIRAGKMRASHILVPTEAEAQLLLEKLNRGASFAELARDFSIDKSSSEAGGDLGFFAPGDLNSEFEEAIMKLEAGETSEVVPTPLRFHIILPLH